MDDFDELTPRSTAPSRIRTPDPVGSGARPSQPMTKSLMAEMVAMAGLGFRGNYRSHQLVSDYLLIT